MRLRQMYAGGEAPVISFELFPPKTPAGAESLWQHVERLVGFGPGYVTCTYGAGGSTRDHTLDIVGEVKRRWGVPVATHLTCVGSTRDDLRAYLAEAERREVDFVVALRGDPPRGDSSFRPVEGGLRYANELVELIRAEFAGFGIAVAGYPEKHVEAPSMEADLANLKRKVDCGADIVITQLFYDNEDFFRFRDSCERLGIDVPGILPITSYSQVERITRLCGARLPEGLVERLEGAEGDDELQQRVGIEHATAQVEELLRQETPGVHFYVLNKSAAAAEVLASVGIAENPSA